MNIKVAQSNTHYAHLTGGECAVAYLEIEVDCNLTLRTKRLLVIHAVLENYCCSWGHDKIEELCGLFEEALDQLGEIE